MKLKCPACGAPISVDSINVQTMTAVCPECDNVFTFDPAKLQPDRKVKPPKQITFYDDAPMHFSFKWDWRTEPLLGLVPVGFLLLFVVLIEGLGIVAFPLMLPIMYILLALLISSTHYKVDDTFLHIYTEPKVLAYKRKSIPLADIAEVVIRQVIKTRSASRPDAYQNIFVRTIDGKEITLARMVNTQLAYFIAQEIESALDSRADAIRHRLEDNDISDADRDDERESSVSIDSQ